MKQFKLSTITICAAATLFGSSSLVNASCDLAIDTITVSDITTTNLAIYGNVYGNVGNVISTTTGISITGGSGAVLGAGTSIDIQNATDSQPGLLTAADHFFFNSKPSAVDVTNIVESFTEKQPQILLQNLTLYVSTNGSDTNSGVTPNSAYRTIRYAVDVASTYYVPAAGVTVTIQVTNGTYAGADLPCGRGSELEAFKVIGDPLSPSSVVITNSTGNAGFWINSSKWVIDGFTFQNCRHGIGARFNGVVSFQNVIFGSGITGSHLYADTGARISANSNYTITGGGASTRHLYSTLGGWIGISDRTIIVTGTPASLIFATADTCGVIQANNTTFSGSATGRRYTADANGVIAVYGGSTSLFPGNVVGATSAGGQYW